MWGLQSSHFLGGISPRLVQSAVRLRNRWLPQLGCDRHQPYDCKGALDGDSGVFSTSSDAKRSRRASRRIGRTALHGAAAAAAAKPVSSDSSASLSGSGQELSVDLDYVPALGLAGEVLCVLLPVLGILAVYTATGRWHGGMLLARLTAVLGAAAGISLTRAAWMERMYKARERAHSELGDDDSRFRPIVMQGAGSGGSRAPADSHRPRGQEKHGHRSLVVHVKVKVGDLSHVSGRAAAVSPASEAVYGEAASSGSSDGTGGGSGGGRGGVDGSGSVFALHCYHGFGANLGSYKRVQAALAAALRGVVTAHDMPGFGLTQRPTDVSSYFLTFNGRLGRLVMDYELQQLGLLAAEAAPGGRARATAEPTALNGGAGMTSTVPTPGASEGGSAVWGGSGVEVVGQVGQVGDGRSRQGGSAPPTQRQRQQPQGREQPAPPPPPPKQQQKQKSMGPRAAASPAIQRILVGHSLGGACAALEAVSDPSGLAGLVLVAPAVIAVPGPEFDQVKLSPQNPGGSPAAASGAAELPQSPSAQRAAEARAAAQLGPEPLASHVTDPPEVRRLYPVGAFPSARPGGGGGQNGGRPPPPGRRLFRALTSLLAVVASLALLCVLRLLVPVITLLLRAMVRSRNFWTKGLQQAYYNPATVTPDIVDLYRMPQLVRGWEAGMVNFLLARLVRSRGSIRDALRETFRAEKTMDAAGAKAKAKASPGIAAVAAAADAEAAATAPSPSPPPPAAIPQQGASHAGVEVAAVSPSTLGSPATTSSPPGVDDGNGVGGEPTPADDHADADLASRLFQLVSERRLPVLIIHGLYDRLVPASNSQRLARMLPGCELVLLDRCGHMPQEEMPELFVSLVAEFADRLAACGAACRD